MNELNPILMNKTPGQINFEHYARSKKGTTYDGKPIPEWDQLGDDVRAAWEAGAYAAIKYFRLMTLTPQGDARHFEIMQWYGAMVKQEATMRADAKMRDE